MPWYFASDVHMRSDRPERADRFTRWVEGLEPSDRLTIVGDLCDFWYVAREHRNDLTQSPGLRALAAFRDRGGALTILPGNHDFWMGRFYEEALGARFLHEPLDVEAAGLRVHLVHGHLLGARKPWKGLMEGRAFLRAFRSTPAPIARGLDHLLENSNRRRRFEDDRRHMEVFRKYADRCRENADLVVFGHIHGPLDDPSGHPRIVVLGGWHHQSSYLRVDESGATLIVEPDAALVAG